MISALFTFGVIAVAAVPAVIVKNIICGKFRAAEREAHRAEAARDMRQMNELYKLITEEGAGI